MSYVCQVWWLPYLLWCLRYSECEDTDTVAVMSNIVGEMSGIAFVLSWKQYWWYHIYWIWCHKYNGCDNIYIGVWCYTWCMLGLAYWIWCHTYSVCDVIQRLGVLYLIHWVWWHRYSGCSVRYSVCDGRYIVCVVMCVMSYIVRVMSWIQWMQCGDYNGDKS